MHYLLKALQGKRRELEQEYTYKNPEDEYLDVLDQQARRQTRKHIMEIKKWERNRGQLSVPTVAV